MRVIEEVHSQVIKTLKKEPGVYVQRYFGQLANYDEPDLIKDELPKILVDFVQEEVDGMNLILSFNLYYVHMAYSANADYRTKTHSDLASLLDATRKRLEKHTAFPIQITQTKKLFDAATKEGYLTLFSRHIKALSPYDGAFI